jgi:phosphatidate cytidylyltransferase
MLKLVQHDNIIFVYFSEVSFHDFLRNNLSEFAKRTIVVVIGIPLAAAVIYAGGWLFAAAAAFISSIGVWEYLRLARPKGLHTHYVPSILASFFTILSFNALSITPSGILFWGLFTIVLILLFLISMILALFSKKPNPLANVAIAITSIIYVAVPWALVVGFRSIGYTGMQRILNIFQDGQFNLAFLENGGDNVGITLVLGLFIAIWSCDIFAYLGGKAFGKHKIFPRVSPKKTIEGSIIGLVGAIAGFTIISQTFFKHFPVNHALAIGLLIGVASQLGDLAESRLKRDSGIKDSSNIIPGHGGILDRFDSLFFAAPTLYFYLIIWNIMI